MKIKFVDNQEIAIQRLTKSYHPEDSRYSLNVIINADDASLEDVVNICTAENTKTVTLIREGVDDVTFSDLKLTYSSEDITESSHEINAFFDLNSADASTISE